MSEPIDPAVSPPLPPPPPPPPIRAARVRDVYDRDDDDRPRPRRGDTGFRLSRTEGVLPRNQVRMACFVVLTLSLVASAALCILAVWGAASSDVAWKAVTSLGIVAATAAGFTVLNEVFGKPADPDRG